MDKPKLFKEGGYQWIQVRVVDEEKADNFLQGPQFQNRLLEEFGLQATRVSFADEFDKMEHIKRFLQDTLQEVERTERIIKL